MRRWVNRPEGSNWGHFGDDDRRGRMNLVTPERRLHALAEAREGVAFLLGLPLDYPKTPLFYNRPPPVLAAIPAPGDKPLYDWTTHDNLAEGMIDVVNDDSVHLTLQYSTQWDGLSHYGICFDADGDGVAEHVFYNGFSADHDFVQPREGVAPCAVALGIENMAETCVQGRGVLVDIRDVEASRGGKVGYAALRAAMDAQGAVVEEGDFLCIYTGFSDLLVRDGADVDQAELDQCVGLDGGDVELLNWIDESGLVAVCADNPMVEKIDGLTIGSGDTLFPLHKHCLLKLGIHLGEFWWFGEIAPWLAANGRAHFLLTAPPLNLPGAVGSPATPVATV